MTGDLGYYLLIMNVTFKDQRLGRLEAEADFDGDLHPQLVKAFRKRMQQIRAVLDERDLYAFKSLRFEKLKGNRSHQHSIRLNDQWRLIVEFTGESPNKNIVIVSIEDYH